MRRVQEFLKAVGEERLPRSARIKNQEFLEAVGEERLPRSDGSSREGFKGAQHRDRDQTIEVQYRGRLVRHRWDQVSDGGSSKWECSLEIALHGGLPEGLKARYLPKPQLKGWVTLGLDQHGAAGPVAEIKWDPRITLRANNPDSLPQYVAERESRLASAILALVQIGRLHWTVEDLWLRAPNYARPSQLLDPMVDLADALDGSS